MDANLMSKLNVKAQKAPLFVWDTFEIWESQVEYLMEDEEMTEAEAQNTASGDYDLYTWPWENLCGWISEWLKDNKFSHFYAEGSSMGWRNHSGYKLFTADTGEEFIRKVVGLDCDYTLRLYEHGKPGDDNYYLYGTVSHHDSPTGEGRTIRPVSGCDECGEAVAPGDGGFVTHGDYEGRYCDDCYDRILELVDRKSVV